MKKLFNCCALAFLIFATATNLKAQAFQKGTKLLDFGLEFQNSFDESVIPVFATFEAGVTDDIGVGAKIRYWSKSDVNSVVIQATGYYHFGRIMKLPVEKLDLFGGLGLGVNRIWIKDYADFSVNSFMVTPNIGARYFFTDRFGVTAKLGLDTYQFNDEDFGYSDRFTEACFSIGASLKF